MKRLRAAAALAILPIMAGGCVAAVIPLAAGGVMAGDKILKKDRGEKDGGEKDAAPTQDAAPAASEVAPPVAAPIPVEADKPTVVAPVAEPEKAVEAQAPEPAPATPKSPARPSAESAASSLQAYQALWTYLSTQAAQRKRGAPLRSVVLAKGATLEAPSYVPCGDKPLAVIFDLDENPLRAVDPDAPWLRWKGDGTDLLKASAGAVDGIEAARREGIRVIFSSGHVPADAAPMAATLERLGFGGVEAGKTLYLRGDAPDPQADDATRQSIAATHCVIALVGDSLGEFSDLFDATGHGGDPSTAATDTMVASLWGAGWFLLPNPVHSILPAPDPSNGEK